MTREKPECTAERPTTYTDVEAAEITKAMMFVRFSRTVANSISRDRVEVADLLKLERLLMGWMEALARKQEFQARLRKEHFNQIIAEAELRGEEKPGDQYP